MDEEEKVYFIFQSEVHLLGKSGQEPADKNWSHGGRLFTFLTCSPWLAQSTSFQNPEPPACADDNTHNVLGLPTSIANQESILLVCLVVPQVVWWGYFLNWDSLFPNDSRLAYNQPCLLVVLLALVWMSYNTTPKVWFFNLISQPWTMLKWKIPWAQEVLSVKTLALHSGRMGVCIFCTQENAE